MVEIYKNRKRCTELESQLTTNWDLQLPNSIALCEDLQKSLELAILKLQESNEFMRSYMERENDKEMNRHIEENELVLRRKTHQLKQLQSHMESLRQPSEIR